MPPPHMPNAEEICDFLMRFTGRDQNCGERKWVSYGWVSKAGCKCLCNESRVLERILLFGVGNICSSHSCLNESFLPSIWTHAVFLVTSALLLCGIWRRMDSCRPNTPDDLKSTTRRG